MGDHTGRANFDVGSKELEIGRQIGSAKSSAGLDSDSPSTSSSGLISDYRGEEVHHGGVEDGFQHDTTTEMKLGVASVGWETLGVQMASTRWIAERQRWLNKPQAEKVALYANKKEARANRSQCAKRVDSINRKASGFYKELLALRDEDYEGWQFFSDSEKARLERIDSHSAFDRAFAWRLDYEESKLQAIVIRYAAWLENIDPKIVRQRFRRNKKFVDQANYVFSVDAEATGVLMAFESADDLLRHIGDPLEQEIVTPRTSRERRHWIISNVLAFYEQGCLMPPYMTHTIDAVLESVSDILIAHEEEQEDEALV